MRISIFCLLPFGIATAANLRQSHGADGLANDADSKDANPLPMVKLTLNNHKGVQYTGPVTLDRQELNAVYDTGSFEIMAVSRQCEVCNLPPGLAMYENSTSSTFRKGDVGVQDHHFAGGLVVARQDFETVHVGTLQSDFKVDNMAFWQVLATDMPVWKNQKASFNAIVGLGHRGAVPDMPDSEKQLGMSLIERTGTQRFAICLVRGPSNPGYLVFNPTYNLNAPNFRRIPVIGEHHWAVSLNSVSITKGDKTSSRCGAGQPSSPCVAIIDSGTSLIGVPPNAVSMVYDVIQKIKYDCSNLDTLPPLIFDLNGQKFAMPASAYTVQFGGTADAPARCLPAFTDFDMTSSQGTVWILGMPFLRHFYTVFDREEPSIYIADQGPDCEPAPVAPAGTFLNASGLRSGSTRATIADINEARLPSWANGQKTMEI